MRLCKLHLDYQKRIQKNTWLNKDLLNAIKLKQKLYKIHFFNGTESDIVIVIVIIHFITKLPWPGDSEGTFRSSSQAATCQPVYHTRRRLHTVSLIAEHQAGKL